MPCVNIYKQIVYYYDPPQIQSELQNRPKVDKFFLPNTCCGYSKLVSLDAADSKKRNQSDNLLSS